MHPVGTRNDLDSEHHLPTISSFYAIFAYQPAHSPAMVMAHSLPAPSSTSRRLEPPHTISHFSVPAKLQDRDFMMERAASPPLHLAR